MKTNIILFSLSFAFFAIASEFSFGQSNSGAVAYASMMEVGDLSGANKQMIKMGTQIVTPSTSNGYSIDISGMGLTNLLGYSITPIKNTATSTSVPNIAVKTESNLAIVVNITEGNGSLVTVLSQSVLLGASNQFANVTGLTLRVTVWGN